MWKRLVEACRRPWVICGVVALCVKLALACNTIGSTDVLTWKMFADAMDANGPVWLYHASVHFNHPPFMARVLTVINWLAEIAPLGFPFWLRLPAILCDFGSLCLMAAILQPNPRLLILLAICPVSIMVSGFHGNTDPVMIFFVLLSIYCLERRHSILAAAAALGVAASIKIVAFVFVPAFLFYLASNLQRLVFLLALGATFGLLSTPYLFQDPMVIVHNVFGYRSMPGVWGFTRLARVLDSFTGGSNFVALAARICQVAAVAAVSGLMLFLSRRPVSLYARCAISIFLFFWLLPGFGVQYLAWLIPFALFFGEGWTIAVYASSGVFLFCVYTFWSDGLPWFEQQKLGGWPRSIMPFELIAWLAIGLTLADYFRRATKNGWLNTVTVPAA
jgi:hypothetical protein